jgi:UDP-3-O-[3-hydroxymyristoyl] glucosamine N-acyltransferase
VTKDVPAGQAVLGSPAVDFRQARKAYALIESLPELKKELGELRKRLAELEARAGGTDPPAAAP